jgi:single-strand DNA-binding protein
VRDVELRWHQGPNGNRAFASFSIACNRNYKNQNGERDADFIECSISGRQAENLANWTRKGSRITVVGSIKTRNYENQQGQRVYVTEIDVRDVEYLDPNPNSQQQGQDQGGYNGGYGQQQQQQGGYNNSYQQQQQQQQQYQQGYQQPPQQGGYQQQQPQQQAQQQQPMAQQTSLLQGNTTNVMDISDDDLPF